MKRKNEIKIKLTPYKCPKCNEDLDNYEIEEIAKYTVEHIQICGLVHVQKYPTVYSVKNNKKSEENYSEYDYSFRCVFCNFESKNLKDFVKGESS